MLFDTFSVRARNLLTLQQPMFLQRVWMILPFRFFLMISMIFPRYQFWHWFWLLFATLGIQIHVFLFLFFKDLLNDIFIDFGAKCWGIILDAPFSSLFRSCSADGVFEGSWAHFGSLLEHFRLHFGLWGFLSDPFWISSTWNPQCAHLRRKKMQNKRRGPSPKWNLSFTQPPLLPGPKWNLPASSFDK